MTVFFQTEDPKKIPENFIRECREGTWYSSSRVFIYLVEGKEYALLRAAWYERLLDSLLKLFSYDYFGSVFKGKKISILSLEELDVALRKVDSTKNGVLNDSKDTLENHYFNKVLAVCSNFCNDDDWSITVGKTKIEFIKGGISGQSLHQVDAVVNAANDTMYYGGAGTNQALSSVFDEKSWEEQARQHHNHLGVSEVAVFDFKPANEDKKSWPKYLFQALGPVLSSDNLTMYQEQVYQAYKNIFKRCRDLKVGSILLCLLSSGIFAGAYQKDPKWHTCVREALFQAILEELEAGHNTLQNIKIIDYSKRPFEKELAAHFKINL